MAVKRMREGQSLTVKQFQRLLGLMAAATKECDTFWTAVHETPCSGGSGPRGFPRGKICFAWSRSCLRVLDMWKKHWFLAQGLMLGAPCHHVTLTTDASLTGWGAVMSGRSAQGLWEGHHLTWHINCLEMLAIFRSLRHFLPDQWGHHVLVRTDNTLVVSYINRQWCLRSCPLYRLAHWILLWAQGKLLSLRAVYIPGFLNQGVDIFSRQALRPGNGGSTPRWWSSSGKSSTRRKWIYLLHKKRHTVHSGSPSYIQLHLGWMQWCRRQVKSPLFI